MLFLIGINERKSIFNYCTYTYSNLESKHIARILVTLLYSRHQYSAKNASADIITANLCLRSHIRNTETLRNFIRVVYSFICIKKQRLYFPVVTTPSRHQILSFYTLCMSHLQAKEKNESARW